ncbi:MAG: carboxypeptidase-like regulatory domain-containing protein [Bacteroidetes bacterium]|nr:carboxypeptidase-like regulatory domain-containing protein [Bacteroidota bacterium]
MKFKNILLTFFFGFFASILFSQTGSITGVVIDKKTRETLVGASVVITGTINGAITDFDGKYAIQKLKPGTYDVTISFVAYTSTNIKGLVVADGKPTILNVQLESGGTDIKTIEVTAEVNRQSSVSLMSTANFCIDGVRHFARNNKALTRQECRRSIETCEWCKRE